MLTQGMTAEQRGELDELLDGPPTEARHRRMAGFAALGGDVIVSRRAVAGA